MTGNIKLEEEVVKVLKEKGYSLTTAESCTGGMIASTLINVAGISEIYKEGYITYANESKQKLLGVEAEALEQFGAVSEEVALQMAKGAAMAAGAEVSVAVTGIAGPGGGTVEKPAGLVYIGCYVHGKMAAQRNLFTGNRLAVRKSASEQALRFLLKCLLEETEA